VVPHIGEVKQIHTHIRPLDKSPFLHTAPSVKSITPSPPYFIKKTLLKNISSVTFTYICVFRFSILVSVAPQKCRFVWYISKHAVAHNLRSFLDTWLSFFFLDSWLSFFFLCFWRNTHVTEFPYTYKPVSDFSDGDSSVCTAWLIACYCWDRQLTELWVEDRHKHEPKI
jgi:hypothetical protein